MPTLPLLSIRAAVQLYVSVRAPGISKKNPRQQKLPRGSSLGRKIYHGPKPEGKSTPTPKPDSEGGAPNPNNSTETGALRPLPPPKAHKNN